VDEPIQDRQTDPMKREAVHLLAILCLLVTGSSASGCAHRPVSAGPESIPYDGPLLVAPDRDIPLYEDPGAAGQVVDFYFEPLGATNESPYNTGEVGDSPDDALRLAVKEGQFDGVFDDLVVRKDEPDRRLYVYQRGGRNYQAAIFHHGPAAKGTGVDEDGIAWWLESYARCDIAEFPDQIAEDRGWEIWTDQDGLRQPIHLINSRRGTDCVAGARFLEIGTGKPSGEAPTQYVANAGQFTDFFNEPYRPHVRLPLDAVVSPYHHGSERLWFSPDLRRAFIGTDPQDVALWPKTTQLLGCAQ
jgi:hypothetical protein